MRGEYCGDQPIRGEYYRDQPMRADLQQGVDHPVPEVGVVVLLVVGSLVRDAARLHHLGRGPGLCRTRGGLSISSFVLQFPRGIHISDLYLNEGMKGTESQCRVLPMMVPPQVASTRPKGMSPPRSSWTCCPKKRQTAEKLRRRRIRAANEPPRSFTVPGEGFLLVESAY